MDMSNHTTVEEQVVYGLHSVGPERTVEVSLKDLLYTYAAIGELVRFFHQPLHYPTLKSVQDFLGDKDQGAFHILCEVYYNKLRDVWPEDINIRIEEGDFDNPNPPYYYKASD